MGGSQSEQEKSVDGMAEPSCTDVPCLVIFLGFLVGMGYCVYYGLQNGDPRRLTHGFDYAGRLCGVDEDVADRPLVFWCGDNTALVDGFPTALNFKDPICEKECPDSAEVIVNCPQPSETKKILTGTAPLITETLTVVQEVKAMSAYPTKAMMNRYCFPAVKQDSPLMQSLLSDPGSPLASTGGRVLDAVGGCRRASIVLGVALVLAVILGYVYLFLLKKLAKILVYSIVIGLTLLFVISSVAFWLTAYNVTGNQANSPIFKRYDHDTAVLYSQILGGITGVLGLIMLILLACFHKSIDTAVGVVEAACSCMFSMPSLLASPILEMVTKVLFFGIIGYGFMWVLSSGEISASSATIGGQKVSGVSRTFKYTKEEIYMILYYCFGYFWTMELCSAFGQFAISYAVVLWYYTPLEDNKKNSPSAPLVRGICRGLRYHLGTLAFGAFLIAVCRLIKLILTYLTKQAEASGNKAAALIGKILLCCVDCFERFLKFVNKNAYIDVAISSSSFCTAMKASFEFIFSQGSSIAVLNGACFVFQVVGSMAIAAGGAFISYLILTNAPMYTDDTSANFIADPQVIAGIAGFLSLIIGIGFMNVFDQTADTLLYAFAWNKKKNPGSVAKYAPEDLASLVGNYTPMSDGGGAKS